MVDGVARNKGQFPSDSLLGNESIPKEVENASYPVFVGEGDGSDRSRRRGSEESTVALFFSLDIVNSTKYKSSTENWPTVISHLLETVVNKVNRENDLRGAHLWRVIGDETVFVLDITLESQLMSALLAIFRIVLEISASLEDGRFFSGIPKQRLDAVSTQTLAVGSSLSIRSTAWTAIICDGNPTAYENIEYRYEPNVSHTNAIVDYLGMDIDAGFRLKEYARARRLVISFDLARLIASDAGDADTYLNIIAYRKLRDVWDDKRYPIIWFHDAESYGLFFENAAVLNATFTDEDTSDEFVQEYMRRLSGDLLDEEADKYDSSTAFRYIEDEMSLGPKFARYREIFAKSGFLELRNGPDDVPLELHCAVVCCDVASRKVLVIHRTMAHETNRDKWEFGCAKASPREHLASRMVDHYRDAYGVDIELVMDGDRSNDVQPKPIAVYEVGDVPSAHKGVIFVASAAEHDFRSTITHDRRAWLTKEELFEIKPEDAVNDFHQTISTVFENFDVFFRT